MILGDRVLGDSFRKSAIPASSLLITVLLGGCGFISEDIRQNFSKGPRGSSPILVAVGNSSNTVYTNLTAYPFTWTAATGEGVDYLVELFSAPNCQGTASFSTTRTTPNFTLGPLADGLSYSVRVMARNAHGDSDKHCSPTIAADFQAPSLTFVSPSGPLNLGATSYNFAWTGADSGLSGLASTNTYFVERFTNGTCSGSPVTSTYLSSGTAGSLNATGLVDGSTYSLRLTAVDRAGNLSSAVCSPPVAVDLSIPTLALRDQTTASTAYTDSTLVDTVITNDSNAAKWCLSESQTTAPASGSSPCSGGGGTFGNDYWFTSRPSSMTLTGTQGSRTVYIWVANAGNAVTTTPVTASIVFDSVAPTSTCTGLGTWINSTSATATPSCTDATSGCASTECRLDTGAWGASCAFSSLSGGAHTIEVRGSDNAGNVQTAAYGTCSFSVDTTAPNLTITAAPTNPDANANPSFTFSATDVGSGIDRYECQIDGGGFSNCTSPRSYTALSTGSHTFDVRALDIAGNSQTVSHTWVITAISSFTITGVRSATVDTIANIWLNANQDPRIDWIDATGESSYEVTIFENDGTTIKCSTATVPANTTSHTFSGCGLTNAVVYRARVRALAGADSRDADNSQFVFGVNIPDSSIVAAYDFNEGSGTVLNDRTGNGHNGSFSCPTWTGSGRFGGALSFSGTASCFVTIADSSLLDLTNNLTLEAWVRTTNTSGYRTIVLKEGGSVAAYQLYSSASLADPRGYVRIGSTDLSVTSSQTVGSGTWAHLAMTFDGSTMRFYVDGVLRGTTPAAGSISATTGALRIGSNSIWPGEDFVGQIDNLRIFNRALSAGEIVTYMNREAALVDDGLPSFSISGVTGGTDSTVDAFLNSGNTPTITWTSSNLASRYEVTIYQNDGVTVQCPTATVTNGTSHTFSGCSLTAATTYKVRVSAISSTGGTRAASNEPFDIFTGIGVVPVYAIYGRNWMDYVANDGSEIYTATGAACPASSNIHTSCIHGGEKNRVTTPYTSCAGLSATDALDAFEWECRLISGTAVMFSKKLKKGRGLRTLLNSTSWISNSVTVAGGAGAPLTTQSTAWWTNSITPLPDNSSGSFVNLEPPTYPAGTIYTLNSSRGTAGYRLNGKLGLVTLGSAVLSYNGSSSSNCNGGDQCVFDGIFDHAWLEGSFTGSRSGGTVDADMIIGYNVERSRVHNSIFSNVTNTVFHMPISVGITGGAHFSDLTVIPGSSAFNPAFNLQNHLNSLFEDIAIKDTVGGGISIWNGTSSGNTFKRIRISNLNTTGALGTGIVVDGVSGNQFFDIEIDSAYQGIQVHNGAASNKFNRVRLSNLSGGYALQVDGGTTTNNVFSDFLISNNLQGIRVTGRDNFFVGLTVVNNTNTGVLLDGGAQRNTFLNTVLANNSNGLVFATSANTNNTFANTVATNNGATGINLANRSNTSKFSGYLLVGSNGTGNCNQTGGTNPGLVNSTCTTAGTDGSSSYTAGFESNAVLRTSRSVVSSFVGKVTSDDTANTTDSSGSAGFPSGGPAAVDWSEFENRFRLWGINGSAFANSDHRGAWSSGTGRIWDWQLLSTDTTIFNRTGDGATSNGSFTGGTNCPSATSDTLSVTNLQTTPAVFLLNAAEIIDPGMPGYDATDNRNGLCEANESCLYMPNFGAYQGHGSLESCTYTPGSLLGITIYGYTSNGN